MSTAAVIQPPEPLTEHERSLTLVKAQPPEPTWAFYVLAASTVLGGWVMGLIYLSKDTARSKGFGLRALLLGFLLPVAVVGIALFIRSTQVPTFTPQQQPGVLLPE